MDNMIGLRIKERRKELGITQTQIQKEAGISSGNLSGIENGKYLPSTAALIGLSQILNCSIDWIITGESKISKNDKVSDISDNPEYELLRLYFEGMDKDDQEELMMIAKMKYNRVQKERKKDAKSSLSDQSGSGVETA